MALLFSLSFVSVLVLLAVPLDKELSYGFQRNTTATGASNPITAAEGLPYTRDNAYFDSQGTACHAWLYTPRAAAQADGTHSVLTGSGAAPAGDSRFPVVIMAHGLGASKELGLHRFAEAFARAGMAVLVFDYRTFGGSDGEPRHWVSPQRHLEDWRAAIRFVKAGSLGPKYDTDKVALWGTSFAGGHVLVVGAEQPVGNISCIISMIPHLDGLETSKTSLRRRGLLNSLRMLAAGLHDTVRSGTAVLLGRLGLMDAAEATGSGAGAVTGESGGNATATHSSSLLEPLRQYLSPAYIKLVGREGEMALMQLSEKELRSYYSKHPAVYEGGWQPRVLARFTLLTSSYRPITSVPHITAPVLFVAATRDGLCPAEQVRSAATQVPEGRGLLLELDCTHFDAYHGEKFEAGSKAMVEFARKHLLGA